MDKQGRKSLAAFVLFGIMVLLTGVVSIKLQIDQEAEMNSRLSDIELSVATLEKQVPAMAEYIVLVRTLQDASRGRLTAHETVEVAKIIMEKCHANPEIGLTPSIILAIMERESGFNPRALSEAKASGIMQVIQTTAEIHIRDAGFDRWTQALSFNPIINTEVGIRELIRLRKYWLEQGIDSWMVALNSYFWGTTATWEIFLNKRRANIPSLEYGKSVMDLASGWREKGVK